MTAPTIVPISHLASHVGEEVTLRGWLYNKRSSGKLHFLEVRDGSGICQCVVFKGAVTPELFAMADHLAQETSLEVLQEILPASEGMILSVGLPLLHHNAVLNTAALSTVGVVLGIAITAQ